MFNLNSPFFRKMDELFDMIVLNLLFLLCCLPIVTIGASMTAMHKVSMKLAVDEAPVVVREFFRAFRENFRQATIAWIIMFVIGAFLYVDMAMSVNGGAFGGFFRIFFGVLVILYFFVLLYLFPMIGRYENTLKMLFRNSLLMSLRALPKTVLMMAVLLVPVLAAAFGSTEMFLILGIAMLLIGFSVIFDVQDRLLLDTFRYYEGLEG